jgi:hypothetical protein
VKPKTKVRLLRQTAPIGRSQVQHSWMRVESRSIVQPYQRKIPELKWKSDRIQQQEPEEHRGYQNGATEQVNATE